MQSNRILVLVVGGLILSLTGGCLERKETIRVDRRGDVSMRVEITGDPGDFGPGDALPDKRYGWDCNEETQRDPDGKESLRRTAIREFKAGEPLPASFLDERDPQYDAALRFPTEVKVEKRKDGTYYHFKRTYAPRVDARYSIYKELMKPQIDAVEQFSGRDPADLTEEERSQLVGVLRTSEALKRGEYIAVAAEALADEWPQDYGLRLRKALMDHYEKVDAQRLLDMLAAPGSPERDRAINEFGEDLVGGGRDALYKELQKLGASKGQIEKFFEAHDAEDARRAVTEDVADERWEVRVELPGEIVAHNATNTETTQDRSAAVIWVFTGKALYDREHVLMVTSRVGRGD